MRFRAFEFATIVVKTALTISLYVEHAGKQNAAMRNNPPPLGSGRPEPGIKRYLGVSTGVGRRPYDRSGERGIPDKRYEAGTGSLPGGFKTERS